MKRKLSEFYLQSRVLTALISIPLLLLAIFLGPSTFYAIWALIWYYMYMEMSDLMDLSPHLKDYMLYLGVLLLILTAGLSSLPFFHSWLVMGLWFLFPVCIFLILIAEKTITKLLPPFYLLYITLPVFFLFVIYENQGPWAIVLLLLSSWIVDTLSYFTGILVGRHPVAPQLSPKKTIEGALGGILGIVMIFPLLLKWIPMPLDGINPYGMGLLLALSAFTGDLFESYIKRSFGKKDSGTILKGHGGMLDRFDSFLFIAFVYAIIFIK